MSLKIFLLCLITMIAFAANSVLCRMALLGTSISPIEFTAGRLIAGAVILLPVIFVHRRKMVLTTFSNLKQSLALFFYALFFSLAYVKVETGVGALILFAAVQITMIGTSILKGNQLNSIEWIGFSLAFSGLIYLMLPGLSTPPLQSATLMLFAGISWGLYSIHGKETEDPIFDTAKNFLFSAPLGVICFFFFNRTPLIIGEGLLLAFISGAITSGLGYILWYLTLRNISTTVASTVQLSVPILAAFGGVFFISESLSLRLIVSTILIFAGIYLTIRGKPKAI